MRRMFIPECPTEDGFTLGELLVVLGIISILASIAIPLYLNQRKHAFDASVLSDVRSLVNAIEDAKVGCPNATIFDIIPISGAAGGNTVSYRTHDGTLVGPFTTWHTLTYDRWLEDKGVIRIYTGHSSTACKVEAITLSPGTNIHLIQEATFSNPIYGEFVLYGWNARGKKYNGSTVTINSNRAKLTQEEMKSVVTYASMDGGLKR